MSKEKQIEFERHEIAEIIAENFRLNDEKYDASDFEWSAHCVQMAGYRKQSEGEWKKRTFIIFDSEKVAFRCSACNTTWDTETNFCPNCGAKMKGGAE